MKLLIAAMLILALSACGHNMNHEYNPLGGATITTIAPPSGDQDAHMIVIQAEIKRLVNEQGITDASLYWIINDSQRRDNMAIYDITITVKDLRARYIFGLTDGVLGMAKRVPVDAEVNCQHEGEQYDGRKQA